MKLRESGIQQAMTRETLILFTRFPRAGRAKTRLISCLGADGAARLQREMTEHVLARVWPLVKRRGVKLEVRFEDGSVADMRRWLGNGVHCVPQGNGDLGARMSRASLEAFAAGARAVVIIGADCPELDAALVGRAFDLLRTHPLIFGPAKDGGYYLVGLGAAMPQLFEGIAWGTGDVLAASTAKVRALGAEPYLLPELSDVDEPADVEIWENARRASRTVSIIIPTLNEAEQLPATLKHAAVARTSKSAVSQVSKPANVCQFQRAADLEIGDTAGLETSATINATPAPEIIVADGGSRDDTLRIAQSCGAKSVNCAANRARQMNAGAAMAHGETLLFLHADTWLPENWHNAVLAALGRPDVVGGAFRFRIADPFPGRWLVESTTNLRSGLWRMPYGDQALFVRRWAFDELGGFPELPIMEDYEFVRRLRRLGKLALLDAAALTSGRRWQRLGCLRTTLINRLVILGYHCGVSPARLALLYRGHSPRPRSGLAEPDPNPRTV